MKLICWATLRHGLLTSKQLATPQLLQKLGVITVHSDSLTHHVSAKVRTLKDITTLAFQEIKAMSDLIFICYASELQRTAVSASDATKLIPK